MDLLNLTSENNAFSTPTIGEIVSKDFRKADVFKNYGLDFCCGGKKTIAEACLEKNIDPVEIEKELAEMDRFNSLSGQKFNRWSPDFLADYILNTHHAYVKEAIPILLEYTRKVAKVHGNGHPEVIEIAENFYAAAEELINHMHKEEQILFPYIKQLVAAKTNTEDNDLKPFGWIQHPIGIMEHEHETVGDLFKNIRHLSDNYKAPEEACATYKVTFLKLQEFEDDLHQHIHLENNILFPKSLQLEKSLFNLPLETA